jgi:lipopolysaccharide/colanic/teichoic acid biosynthesis glycosyltransferase
LTAFHPIWRDKTSPHDSVRHPLRFLARNRYQLLGAALLGVVAPALLRTGFTWGSGSMPNTAAGTFAAMLLGAYLLRRVTGFPGTRSEYYVLPVFLITFGVAVALFFFLRLDYSRLQFLMSFAFVVGWFGLVRVIERRVRRPNLSVLPFGDAKRVMTSEGADWMLIRSSEELPAGATGIVADFNADLAAEWERFLAKAVLAGIPVYHWKQTAESLTGRVEIEHLSENTFGSLLPSSIYLRFKRLIDVAATIVALPLIVLVAGPAALAIWLFDGRPILFRQARIGLGARPFTMLKFRTMRCCGGEGRPFTEADDPRVTRVGRFLRRTRIDELPQVVNILRGEMSWIGPRPEAVELAEWYESQIAFYSYRHSVRPGVTGWAQVHQGNVAEIKAATGKLHYDFYYIKYFSPWLDLLIAAKTLPVLLTGHGAR